ncbi:MAG: hypothetical protein Q7T03_04850 [Deltaproteobacteria bacterium]|nr:hypothetical protein [Deltaproteobacteria bacterium]
MKEIITKVFSKQGLTVLVIVVVLVGFLLANSYLKEKNHLARERLEQEKVENDRKFDADQKESCLAIYKQESSKWNNVNGWRYNEADNACFIQYKKRPAKTKAQCDAEYIGKDEKVVPVFLMD